MNDFQIRKENQAAKTVTTDGEPVKTPQLVEEIEKEVDTQEPSSTNSPEVAEETEKISADSCENTESDAKIDSPQKEPEKTAIEAEESEPAKEIPSKPSEVSEEEKTKTDSPTPSEETIKENDKKSQG